MKATILLGVTAIAISPDSSLLFFRFAERMFAKFFVASFMLDEGSSSVPISIRRFFGIIYFILP